MWCSPYHPRVGESDGRLLQDHNLTLLLLVERGVGVVAVHRDDDVVKKDINFLNNVSQNFHQNYSNDSKCVSRE